jgi:deoxycytidylate deaminase
MEILTVTYKNFRHPPIAKLLTRMKRAATISFRSHDERLRVGCVITNSKYSILNQDCNRRSLVCKNKECVNPVTKSSYSDLLHAEVATALGVNSMTTGMIAFVTSAPCERCIGVLAEKGVTEIYFMHDHDYNVGVELFETHYGGKATKIALDSNSFLGIKENGYSLIGYLFDIEQYKGAKPNVISTA